MTPDFFFGVAIGAGFVAATWLVTVSAKGLRDSFSDMAQARADMDRAHARVLALAHELSALTRQAARE